MPRKPQYTPDEIYGVLKDKKFMEDGKYLSFNHPIWKEASNLLPGMSELYLWVYITNNRNDISERIHGPLKQKRKRKICNISNWSLSNNNKGLRELKDTIHLSTQEWNKFGVKLKRYKDEREYEILEPGWTDKIYTVLWNKCRLPCPFTFQTAKINRNPEEHFLKIRGFCNECGNEINIYSTSEPTSNGIDMHVSTFDTSKVHHKKKRQLRANRREIVADQLKAQSTFMWRRHTANQQMNFKDQEPADLYKPDVLRKAKQRKIYQDLDVQPFTDEVQAIKALKRNPKYSESIRQLGIERFFVMYWSPEQLYLYKLFLKNDPLGSVSIDATGSIIKSNPTIDSSKRIIFLYQAIASYKNVSIPLFQMISEKHDANTLSYWLGEWLRCGVKAPKQLVCDYSLALLNASSIAFNQMSLNRYVDECFEYITGSQQQCLNKQTILRIDIAHIIKFISKWPCLKTYHQKDFYVRCVGFLIKCSTLTDFKKILKLVLTVAYTKKYEEKEDNICHNYCNQLLSMIKTGKNPPSFPENHLFADMSIVDEEGQVDSETIQKPRKIQQKKLEKNASRPIQDYLQKIKDRCQLDITGNVENKYYNPDFAQRLINFSKNFVLWTAIIPTLFYKHEPHISDQISTASSAISEEYFKDIKKLILNDEKNLRVDKYLTIHLNALSGTMNLIAANRNIKHETNSEIDSTSLSDFSGLDSNCDKNLTSIKTDNCKKQNEILDGDNGSSSSLDEYSKMDNGDVKNEPTRDSDIAVTINSSNSFCDENVCPNYNENSYKKEINVIDDDSDNSGYDDKNLVINSDNVNNEPNRALNVAITMNSDNSFCDENVNPNYNENNYKRKIKVIDDNSDNSDYDDKNLVINSDNVNNEPNRALNVAVTMNSDNSFCDENLGLDNEEHRFKEKTKVFDIDYNDEYKNEEKDLNLNEFKSSDNMAMNISFLCKAQYGPPICSSTLKNNNCDSVCIVKKNDKEPIINHYSSNNSLSSSSNNAHLNYVDEWKGLLTKKKKQSHYLKELPNIENLHKLPRCPRMLPLLINGTSMPPVKTSQGVIKVKNTCAVDSILHAIRGGYVDKYDYYRYVESSHSKVFEIVKLLSHNKPTLLHKKRAELILTYKKVDKNSLDATINVGTVIDTIMEDEPSFIIEKNCNRCNILKDTRLPSLTVDFTPIFENGIAGLQEGLDMYLKSNINVCKKCRKCRKNSFPTIKCQNHLFIDIEELYWKISQQTKEIVKTTCDKFSLLDIPDRLTVCEKNFSLVATIEHEWLTDIGHYRAIIKRKTGKWEIHDGINKNSVVQTLNSKQSKENRKLHILFYVRDNEMCNEEKK